MSEEWETTHSVTDAMQRAFVDASGDSNPLHTDSVVARRLPFGRVAVHGMHLALDALDRLATRTQLVPERVRCTFRRSVGVGDLLTTRVTMSSDADARIVIEHDVWRVADLQVRLARSTPSTTDRSGGRRDAGVAPIDSPPAAVPTEVSESALASAAGSIDVLADVAALRRRFPGLLDVMGQQSTAELVTLTRLVGMHLPGLHSLFSSFDIDVRSGDGSDELRYAVRRFDERFAKATIEVEGRTVEGSVIAFVRPRPVEPTIGDTRPRPDEFAGQRWLVVGGSRGLGATTSMLVAAGGGDVRLTYRIGADDADRLAASIGATAHTLDVTDVEPDLGSIVADGWHPTHLAYFASPPIFDGTNGAYSHRLEQRFRSIYVDGFDAVLERLAVDRLHGVLWPSSEAVDHDVPGLAEYTTVKRQGEERCAELARDHEHLTVATPRLPRLRTDQTSSFLPIEYDDAPSTVLRALRAFSG